MCADRWFQSLGAELRQWAAGLWPIDALPRRQQEVDRLERELRERHALLDQLRSDLEAVRDRLAQATEREALLTSWVQTHLHVADQPSAYRYAMELDQLRGQLRKDQESCRASERVYNDQLTAIRPLERRLAELQAQLEHQPG
jgi:hypothetical protein